MDMVMLSPIIGAIAYALIGLFRSYPAGEEPSGAKFVVTVVIGIVAGYIMMTSGVAVTEASFLNEMTINSTLYMGITYAVNKVISGIYDFLSKKAASA